MEKQFGDSTTTLHQASPFQTRNLTNPGAIGAFYPLYNILFLLSI
jgi:hypothetical protein